MWVSRRESPWRCSGLGALASTWVRPFLAPFIFWFCARAGKQCPAHRCAFGGQSGHEPHNAPWAKAEPLRPTHTLPAGGQPGAGSENTHAGERPDAGKPEPGGNGRAGRAVGRSPNLNLTIHGSEYFPNLPLAVSTAMVMVVAGTGACRVKATIRVAVPLQLSHDRGPARLDRDGVSA